LTVAANVLRRVWIEQSSGETRTQATDLESYYLDVSDRAIDALAENGNLSA